MHRILLEAPVYTLEAALLAQEFGVDRLELCADYGQGGTTPGAGMLAYLKSHLDIPVFVMIRPRGGDFVFSAEEIQVMGREISILKNHGADGFVFGLLKANGTVDTDACLSLMEKAGSMPCTFHRAFDATANLEDSLEKIIACGFQRILTSGGKQTVREGLPVIQELLRKAGERITIIPGGGTSPDLLRDLHAGGNLKEVHASCKRFRSSQSTFVNQELDFSEGGEGSNMILTIDRNLVHAFKDAIGKLESQI